MELAAAGPLDEPSAKIARMPPQHGDCGQPQKAQRAPAVNTEMWSKLGPTARSSEYQRN